MTLNDYMMMADNKIIDKTKVALVRCDTYNVTEVYEAVKEGLQLIGGVSRFIKSGEKIVIKPNVLIGSAPDKCVCTHPSVFGAVVGAGKILKLSQEKLANAIGLAGYVCPPDTAMKFVSSRPINMVKYGPTGWIAQAGVTSARIWDLQGIRKSLRPIGTTGNSPVKRNGMPLTY